MLTKLDLDKAYQIAHEINTAVCGAAEKNGATTGHVLLGVSGYISVLLETLAENDTSAQVKILEQIIKSVTIPGVVIGGGPTRDRAEFDAKQRRQDGKEIIQ